MRIFGAILFLIALAVIVMFAAPYIGMDGKLAPLKGFLSRYITFPEPPVVSLKSVKENGVITSPVKLTGEARGFWFFEGSFPIYIKDANGTTLGTGVAQAIGDWMTANFVVFTTEVSFSDSKTETGVIVLQKDNPSGLPENDASIEIPIRFRK